MIAILRQYPFGTDKAVQISRAECFNKDTQLECSTRKKQNHRINQDISFFLMPGCFGFKRSENFNNALSFNHSQSEKMRLEFLTFKMTIKI